MTDRTIEGRSSKIFAVLNEYSRECLAINAERSLQSIDGLEFLADLFIEHGLPDYSCYNNGPEYTAKQFRAWLGRLGVSTLIIELGSLWENGYVESFNGKLREEYLNREVFTTLVEAKVLIEQWRNEYDQIRPHSSCGYRPPAPEAILPLNLDSATLRPNPMVLT